jgi:hypothetical protein
MLDIILTILKYAGMGVGILLAIVLVLLILVLFVPIRYKVEGENKEALQAKGTVHWLFHIVTYRVYYENEELKQVLRIFGVPVWKK